MALMRIIHVIPINPRRLSLCVLIRTMKFWMTLLRKMVRVVYVCCHSTASFRALKKVKLTYQDIHGDTHNIIAEGFEARMIQHECDHLEGKIYPMRITDLTQFGFRDEIRSLLLNQRK